MIYKARSAFKEVLISYFEKDCHKLHEETSLPEVNS